MIRIKMAHLLQKYKSQCLVYTYPHCQDKPKLMYFLQVQMKRKQLPVQLNPSNY